MSEEKKQQVGDLLADLQDPEPALSPLVRAFAEPPPGPEEIERELALAREELEAAHGARQDRADRERRSARIEHCRRFHMMEPENPVFAYTALAFRREGEPLPAWLDRWLCERACRIAGAENLAALKHAMDLPAARGRNLHTESISRIFKDAVTADRIDARAAALKAEGRVKSPLTHAILEEADHLELSERTVQERYYRTRTRDRARS